MFKRFRVDGPKRLKTMRLQTKPHMTALKRHEFRVDPKVSMLLHTGNPNVASKDRAVVMVS